MKRGSEGEEREVTEKREEDNEVGRGLVNDAAWRTPPEAGAGGRNWGRTREGGMCSWGRPANVLKLAFVLGNSQYLAPAPSQGEVQGYLVCSPVLTGCCLRLSTPTNWGVQREMDAQIGFREIRPITEQHSGSSDQWRPGGFSERGSRRRKHSFLSFQTFFCF